MRTRDECHESSSYRNLDRFEDTRVLEEGRKERHHPGDTPCIAVCQAVHDGDKGRHDSRAYCHRPGDVDEPPRQAENDDA